MPPDPLGANCMGLLSYHSLNLKKVAHHVENNKSLWNSKQTNVKDFLLSFTDIYWHLWF